MIKKEIKNFMIVPKIFYPIIQKMENNLWIFLGKIFLNKSCKSK